MVNQSSLGLRNLLLQMFLLMRDKKVSSTSCKNGEQCKTARLRDDTYCFWHSKKTKSNREEAVVRGGQATRRYELNVADWEYKDSQSIIRLLELCINQTIQGRMPSRVANSVAYLANALLTAVRDSELEKRLEVVEYVLKSKKDTH